MEEQNTFDGISLAPQRRKQNALRIFLLGVGCLFLFGSLALYHVESVRQRDLQEKQLAQAVQGSSCFLKGRERQAMDWIATTTATFRKLNNAESLKITEQMHLTLDAKLFLLDKEGRLLNKAREEARQTDNQEFLLDASSDLKQLQLAATVQQPASGYFQEQGRIYFGVAGKVDSGAVQHVILVLPLNSSLLRQMKQLVNADLVALSEAGLEILSKVIGAVFTEKHTESFIDGAVLRLVAFPAKNSSLQETISDGEKPIGVFLLPDVNGSSVGGVVVILPEQKEAMYLPAGITALFGVFSLAWWLALRLKAEEGSSRERRFISRRALSSRRSVDGYLHDLQAMQQKNTELLEMQRIMQKKLEERAIIVPYYQRFFQNSPVGIFQCTIDGQLQQINQSFAVMLGYDSAVHLMSEQDTLMDMCLEETDAKDMLAFLREQPSVRHAVVLRAHDGTNQDFWMMSIASNGGDRDQPIEGFLLERTQENLLDSCRHELEKCRYFVSSLGLFAVSSLQAVQVYFLDAVPAFRPGEEETADDLFERNKKEQELHAAFDTQLDFFLTDLHDIGLYMSEGSPSIATSLDIATIAAETHDQLRPLFSLRKIDFGTSVAGHILDKLNAPVSLLRHTLVRSLLFVVGNHSGGHANLVVHGLVEDPRQAGTAWIRFTVSWEVDPSEAFALHPGADSDEAAAPHTFESLDQAQEFTVLKFLAARLHGKIQEGADEPDSRSIDIIVRLEHVFADEKLSPDSRAVFEKYLAKDDENAASDESSEFPGDTEDRLEPETMALTEGISEESLNLLVETDFPDPRISAAGREEEGLDILLVEDSINSRMLFSLYLRGTPHRIVEARDGLEGVELFKEKKFDVVFMDMEMPLLDGYQATRIIRAYEADTGQSPIPIIAQTAHVLPEFKGQCMRAGCSEFLSKPFSRNTLLVMLATLRQKDTLAEG